MMMDFLTNNVAVNYILPFVVTLTIVVFVHEFGHFWVARRCGVRILVFSIGMGKEIFGRTDKRGTRWKFSWLPLGGYVQMYGDADPTSATVDQEAVTKMTEVDRREAFFAKNVWQRIAIIVAGPAANYLFAIVALIALFLIFGQPMTPPLVNSVTENSAAATAGIKPGDLILSVDEKEISKFSELQRFILLNVGKPMALKIKRGTDILTLSVTPKLDEQTDRFGNKQMRPRLGVTTLVQTEEYRRLNLWEAVHESFATTGRMTVDTVTVIGQMIIGTRGTEDVGGPLRIAQISGDIVKTREIGDFVMFLVLLSVNLGFVNLLPIPLLDGGHIFFYLIEAIRGRPLSEETRNFAAHLGLTIVGSLMLFALFNDLVHLKFFAYLKTLFS
jgi:regulator of sigma E protease